MKNTRYQTSPEVKMLLIPFLRHDRLLVGIIVAHAKTAVRRAAQLAKTVPPENRDEIFSRSIAIFSIKTMPFPFQLN